MTFEAPTWQEANDAITRLKSTLAAEALQTTGTIDDRSPGRYHDVVVSYNYIESIQNLPNQLFDCQMSVQTAMMQNSALNDRVMELQARNNQLQQQITALMNSHTTPSTPTPPPSTTPAPPPPSTPKWPVPIPATSVPLNTGDLNPLLHHGAKK